MISTGLACCVIIGSLLTTLAAYIWLSKRESTYINILTPAFIIQVPGNFLFQLAYIGLFGTEYSTYAYIYVYCTLAIESWAFVLAYAHDLGDTSLPKRSFSYRNFTLLSLICLGLACATYAPVLLQFRDYLLDPRQIYQLTRTGFGQETVVSSTLAYLAVIFILFTKRSRLTKAAVVVVAGGLLVLHGSKGQVLDLILLLLLFQVYVRRQKIRLLPALARSLAVAGIVVVLFAVTVPLGDGLIDAIQEISQYSDYTRNAMLVIDSHLPVQYGRLTVESNVYVVIPRVLMPSKPKNFGIFYLDEQFYPERFDADTGSPDFGIGVQYADFGALAIVYLVLFSVFRGRLARIFVTRLRLTEHPSDFFMVLFLADISVFPLGGGGWLLPEAMLVTIFICFASRIGAARVIRLARIRSDSVFGAHA